MIYMGCQSSSNMEGGMIIGYATMILAFVLIYFAQVRYRENIGGGIITYGQAFKVGILVAIISSLCYVITWMFISHFFMPDFMEKYTAHEIQKLQASGMSAEQLAAKTKEMNQMAEMYKNPFFKAGLTFLEIFPVGLLVTIISSFIVRIKNRKAAAV